MGIDVERYNKLKKQVDLLQQEVNRAEGALSQTMSRLKEEFDVDSIEQAEKLKKKLEKEATDAESAYDDEFEEFEDKWGELLEEGSE